MAPNQKEEKEIIACRGRILWSQSNVKTKKTDSRNVQTSTSTTRAAFTNDGVSLEEDVVAFTAANLEDQFTDVEQVVSTDSQLREKHNKPAF